MRLPLWPGLIAVLLILGGCAGPGGTSQKAVQAAPVPAGYVGLSEGDLRKPKSIRAIVDFDAPLEQNEGRLQIMFPLLFAGAVQDPSTNVALAGVTGTGLAADTPLTFPALEANLELTGLGTYLARHFPGHRDVVGSLYRAPDKSYVVRVAFHTLAGANALYFNVTRWAERKKSLYS